MPASRKVIHSGSREPRSIGIAQMNRWRVPRVLFVANNEHGLTDKRVKGVGDHHLKRQTPGIMSSRPGKARVSGEAIDTSTRSIRRGSGHGTSERWFG